MEHQDRSGPVNAGAIASDAVLPHDDALDRALRAALAPPPLPPMFHAALLHARDAGEEAALALRRATLERERDRQLRDMRAGYLRLRRETVATIIAASFTAGAAGSVAVPSLMRWLHMDLATLGLGVTAVLVLGLVVAVVGDRFGLLRT